jgi:cell division protein FtsZ
MDANDAASYVQDLAGDDANIIFGAKYDETMVDEATITVIATGLDVATTKPMSSMPGMIYAQNQRPVASPVYTTRTTNAANTQSVAPSRPVSTTSSASQTQQTSNPAYTSGIQKPRQPESSVKPVEISIPDFLKNSRR